jgi:hypothetical protein
MKNGIEANGYFFLSNSRWTSKQNENELFMRKFLPIFLYAPPPIPTSTRLSLADGPSGAVSLVLLIATKILNLQI